MTQLKKYNSFNCHLKTQQDVLGHTYKQARYFPHSKKLFFILACKSTCTPESFSKVFQQISASQLDSLIITSEVVISRICAI